MGMWRVNHAIIALAIIALGFRGMAPAHPTCPQHSKTHHQHPVENHALLCSPHPHSPYLTPKVFCLHLWGTKTRITLTYTLFHSPHLAPPRRYVSNDTPGAKSAKLRLLQKLGWTVLPIAWVER